MRTLILSAVLFFVAGAAQAATLIVVDEQLHGASNVLVGGVSYDVQFLDGTCIELYKGCDEASDFTFQTQASALLASQALLDQVFLDGALGAFDNYPGRTRGCPYPPLTDVPDEDQFCIAATPFGLVTSDPNAVVQAHARNSWEIYLDNDGENILIPAIFPRDAASITDASGYDPLGVQRQMVYAVWAPSEPSTAVPTLPPLGLVLLSALMMGLASRRLA